MIIQGTVVDVERDGGGLPRGAATVQSAGRDGRRRVRVELQNEYLLALEDGAPCAMVPDLVSVLAADTGVPVLAERLAYGQRVTVIASPAPDVWRSEAALALVGPGAFGYDLDYTPMSDGAPDGDG